MRKIVAPVARKTASNEEPDNLSFVGANPGSNLRVISVLVCRYLHLS